MDEKQIKQIKEGAITLIDVRASMELLVDGRIDGAIHIPLDELPHRLEEVQKMKKPLAFFCAKGFRAQKAIDILTQSSEKQVYNAGGYKDVKQMLEKN